MIYGMVLVFSGKSSSYSSCLFQCVKAAELIGTFVSPKVWMTLITSAFRKTPKPSCLMVLSAVIRGSPKEIIQPHLTDLGNTLSQAAVCQQSEEVKYTTEQSSRPRVLQLIFSLVLPKWSHCYPSLAHLPLPISGYICGCVWASLPSLSCVVLSWSNLLFPQSCLPVHPLWVRVWELLCKFSESRRKMKRHNGEKNPFSMYGTNIGLAWLPEFNPGFEMPCVHNLNKIMYFDLQE